MLDHTFLPCSACGWTSNRQNLSGYKSHVRLFEYAGDEGKWSLGSKLVLKERNATAPDSEAASLRFVKENTSLPVSTVVEEWEEPGDLKPPEPEQPREAPRARGDGRYFLLTKRVPGVPLSIVWDRLKMEHKEHIAKQTAEYLMQLRGLQSNAMESLGNKPLSSRKLFAGSHGAPDGLLSSDKDLWAAMELGIVNIPERTRQLLGECMPSAAPYTFTHGNLSFDNILIDSRGNLSGILDWEAAGYFPVWWEYVSAGISMREYGKEWKALLLKNMPDYSGAREWWFNYYALSMRPISNEQLMSRLQLEMVGDISFDRLIE
ncbi:hypothetical protein AbraIFM66950_007932 [Aspergillus brasiliensis]|nr:hypothetical protein AbraIFM66950_007932 [Aspergillus brasiliensis]